MGIPSYGSPLRGERLVAFRLWQNGRLTGEELKQNLARIAKHEQYEQRWRELAKQAQEHGIER